MTMLLNAQKSARRSPFSFILPSSCLPITCLFIFIVIDAYLCIEVPSQYFQSFLSLHVQYALEPSSLPLHHLRKHSTALPPLAKLMFFIFVPDFGDDGSEADCNPAEYFLC